MKNKQVEIIEEWEALMHETSKEQRAECSERAKIMMAEEGPCVCGQGWEG